MKTLMLNVLSIVVTTVLVSSGWLFVDKVNESEASAPANHRDRIPARQQPGGVELQETQALNHLLEEFADQQRRLVASNLVLQQRLAHVEHALVNAGSEEDVPAVQISNDAAQVESDVALSAEPAQENAHSQFENAYADLLSEEPDTGFTIDMENQFQAISEEFQSLGITGVEISGTDCRTSGCYTEISYPSSIDTGFIQTTIIPQGISRMNTVQEVRGGMTVTRVTYLR